MATQKELLVYLILIKIAFAHKNFNRRLYRFGFHKAPQADQGQVNKYND